MGIFDEAEVKKAFDISDEYGVGAIIPIGYAEVQPDVRPRKEVSELLKFIQHTVYILQKYYLQTCKKAYIMQMLEEKQKSAGKTR